MAVVIVSNTMIGATFYKPQKAEALLPAILAIGTIISTAFDFYKDIAQGCDPKIPDDCETVLGKFINQNKPLLEITRAIGKAAWIAAKTAILDELVNNIIGIIQTGGRGGSWGATGQFVSDRKQFETSAKNAALESFLADMEVTNFCQEISPGLVGIDIKQLLGIPGNPPPVFGVQSVCSLDKKRSVTKEYQNKLEKFFSDTRDRQFDWDVFTNVTQPQGNIFSVYLIGQEQKLPLVEDANKYLAQINRSESLLEQAGGWIGLEQCTEWNSSTWGAKISRDANAILRVVSFSKEVNKTTFETLRSRCDIEATSAQCQTSNTVPLAQCSKNLNKIDGQCLLDILGENTFSCGNYKTLTPGDQVAQLTSKALGLKLDSLVASDLKNYTDAILTAFVQRIFEEGKGLLGFNRQAIDAGSCRQNCRIRWGNIADNKPFRECSKDGINQCFSLHGKYDQKCDKKKTQTEKTECQRKQRNRQLCDENTKQSCTRLFGDPEGENTKRIQCDASCSSQFADRSREDTLENLDRITEEENKLLDETALAIKKYNEVLAESTVEIEEALDETIDLHIQQINEKRKLLDILGNKIKTSLQALSQCEPKSNLGFDADENGIPTKEHGKAWTIAYDCRFDESYVEEFRTANNLPLIWTYVKSKIFHFVGFLDPDPKAFEQRVRDGAQVWNEKKDCAGLGRDSASGCILQSCTEDVRIEGRIATINLLRDQINELGEGDAETKINLENLINRSLMGGLLAVIEDEKSQIEELVDAQREYEEDKERIDKIENPGIRRGELAKIAAKLGLKKIDLKENLIAVGVYNDLFNKINTKLVDCKGLE